MEKIMRSATVLKSPSLFYIFALVCIFFVIFITPERLIALGPMRNSLTSVHDSVREIAHLEVLLLRILFFLGALLLVAIGLNWKRIIASSIVHTINTHVPRYNANFGSTLVVNAPFIIIISFLALGLSYMQFGPDLLSRQYLKMVYKEDGLIEYLSVFFIVIACLLSAVVAYKLLQQRARFIVHIFLALVFFLMAGEEISWGQRIFGLDTPEAFKSVNVQGETNFHNMLGYFSDHIFIVAILLYGFVLPMLAHFSVFVRNLCDLIGLPIASFGLAFGFLIASLVHSWVIYRFIDPPTGFRVSELRELLTAIALAFLMFEAWVQASNKNNQ